MKAFILAAGRGERMRPLTDSTPKPLLAVGGEPIIVHTIRRLAAAGVSELVINISYLAEQVRSVLADGGKWSVNINYSMEEVALETAGGVVQALPLLGEAPFILVNGDIWTDFDFSALADLELGDSLAHLVMVDNPAHNPDGDFFLDTGALSLTEGESLTYSGIGLYSPKLFSGLTPGKRPLAPLLREAISNSQLSAEKFTGSWEDIGTPERLSQLNQELKNPDA